MLRTLSNYGLMVARPDNGCSLPEIAIETQPPGNHGERMRRSPDHVLVLTGQHDPETQAPDASWRKETEE